MIDLSKKLRTFSSVNGRLSLESSHIGSFTDENEKEWQCFAPDGLRMSVWVRLEREGHKAHCIYDPGGEFKRNQVKPPQ